MKNCFTTSLAFVAGLLCFCNVLGQNATAPCQLMAFQLSPDSSILDLGYYDFNPYADSNCTSGCGEGVAYHEENSTSDDSLSPIPCNAAFMWSGADYIFRRDECVDVMQCYGIANTENWHNLSYIEPGEWVKYTVDVQRPGYYEIEALLNPISKMGVEILNGTESMAYDLTTYNQIQKFNFVSNEASTNEDWKHWSWKSPYLNGAPATVGVLFDQAGLQTITIKFSSYEENQISSMGGDLGPIKFKFYREYSESEHIYFNCNSLDDIVINSNADTLLNLTVPVAKFDSMDILGVGTRSDNQPLSAPFVAGTTTTVNWTFNADSTVTPLQCSQTVSVRKQVTVTLNSSANGYVTFDNTRTYMQGDTIIFSAFANNGYSLKAWNVNGKLFIVGPFLQLTLDSDVEVSAVFERNNCRTCAMIKDVYKIASGDSAFVNIPQTQIWNVSTCYDSIIGVATRDDNKSTQSPFPVGLNIITWKMSVAGDSSWYCYQRINVEKNIRTISYLDSCLTIEDGAVLDLGYYDVNPIADSTCTSACGEGVTYHEENSTSDESTSEVPCNGAFKWSGAEYDFRKNECVDVTQCYGLNNTEGWHNLSYIEPGEWIVYTVDVKKAGYYSVEALLNAEADINFSVVSCTNLNENLTYNLDSKTAIASLSFSSPLPFEGGDSWKIWSWCPTVNKFDSQDTIHAGLLFKQAGKQTIKLRFSDIDMDNSLTGDLGPLKFKYVAPFESENDCDTICPMKKTHINVISDVPYINVNLKGEQAWMNDCNEEIFGKVSRQDLKSIMSAFPMGTSILNWEMTDGSRSWNCTQEIIISDSLMSLDSALVNLIITPKEGGSVIGLNEGVSFVKKDSSLTLFAVADSAYEFATWKVDGVLCSTDSAILTLSFDFAHTVEAVFRAIPMSPTSEAENGISIAPDSSFVNISWQKEADADKYRLTI